MYLQLTLAFPVFPRVLLCPSFEFRPRSWLEIRPSSSRIPSSVGAVLSSLSDSCRTTSTPKLVRSNASAFRCRRNNRVFATVDGPPVGARPRVIALLQTHRRDSPISSPPAPQPLRADALLN